MDQDRVDRAVGHRLAERRDVLLAVGASARHMRGDWLKIWIAAQPRSTPRSIAFGRPPAGETCAPISMAAILCPAPADRPLRPPIL